MGAGTLIGSVLPFNSTYLGLLGPYPTGPVYTGGQGSTSNTSVAGPNGVVIYDNVLYLVNQNKGKAWPSLPVPQLVA